jgi:predicted nucleic acid-binding protein
MRILRRSTVKAAGIFGAAAMDAGPAAVEGRPMRFWDGSAIVPLLMTETKALRGLAAEDPAMLMWWATEVECASPFCTSRTRARARPAGGDRRLKRLAEGWHEVDPSDGIGEAAVSFLRVHPLRADDALQLAAAFVAAERRPSSLEVITLDERLAAAARKECFPLIEVPSRE